jgi:hypothetical protein
MTFTVIFSIMHFYPNLTLRDIGTMLRKEFEENQNYVGDEFHQHPEHPFKFMKMVKERTLTISAVNDERSQVLPSKVILDAAIGHFEVFRNYVEGHYEPIGAV